jgi:hypothetical protein
MKNTGEHFRIASSHEIIKYPNLPKYLRELFKNLWMLIQLWRVIGMEDICFCEYKARYSDNSFVGWKGLTTFYA